MWQKLSKEERLAERKRRKSLYNKNFKERAKAKMTAEEFEVWEAKRIEDRKMRDKQKKHIKFLSN